jgi:hypothetical protein
LGYALKETSLPRDLAERKILQLEAEDFNAAHRAWCQGICLALSKLPIDAERVTYGRAAKLVAIYLKTIVIITGRPFWAIEEHRDVSKAEEDAL